MNKGHALNSVFSSRHSPQARFAALSSYYDELVAMGLDSQVVVLGELARQLQLVEHPLALRSRARLFSW